MKQIDILLHLFEQPVWAPREKDMVDSSTPSLRAARALKLLVEGKKGKALEKGGDAGSTASPLTHSVGDAEWETETEIVEGSTAASKKTSNCFSLTREHCK